MRGSVILNGMSILRATGFDDHFSTNNNSAYSLNRRPLVAYKQPRLDCYYRIVSASILFLFTIIIFLIQWKTCVEIHFFPYLSETLTRSRKLGERFILMWKHAFNQLRLFDFITTTSSMKITKTLTTNWNLPSRNAAEPVSFFTRLRMSKQLDSVLTT